MKKNTVIAGLFLFSMMIICGTLQAQSLDEQLKKLSNAAASEYLAPAVDGFGSNVNSGWMNTPPAKKKLGFDLQIGFVGMVAPVNESRQSFYKETTFRFDYKQAQELTTSLTDPAMRQSVINQIITKDFNVSIFGSTIIGGKANTIKILFAPSGSETFDLTDPIPATVTLPKKEVDLGIGGLLNYFTLIPSGAPQIKIGTVYGTRAIIRFLPGIALPNNAGTFNYFGFGLEHNIGYWLNETFPVDFTAGFLVQNFKIGSTVSTNTSAFGLNASKTFLKGFFQITPYAGFQIEKATMDVDYQQVVSTPSGNVNTSIKFSLDAGNSSKFTLGSYFKIAMVGIAAEYNFAKNSSATASLLFNF